MSNFQFIIETAPETELEDNYFISVKVHVHVIRPLLVLVESGHLQ